MSGTNRPDVQEAKKRLRKAYLKNPNPSNTELIAIANEVGRGVGSVTRWFENKRSSSNANTPEPPHRKGHAQESSRHNGGPTKQRVPPEQLETKHKRPSLDPKPNLARSQHPAPTQQTVDQPACPQPKPAPLKPAAQISLPTAPPITVPHRATQPLVNTSPVVPLVPREEIVDSTGEFIASQRAVTPKPKALVLAQRTEEAQSVMDEPRGLPDPSDFPEAFEGVTKLQHELHCAMALYYQATQGLPMTFPESHPSK